MSGCGPPPCPPVCVPFPNSNCGPAGPYLCLPEQRIIGGVQANIASYPYAAVLLRYNSNTGTYVQQCGGAIINNRSVLTSVNCIYNDAPRNWIIRVGSSLANSGGQVLNVGSFIIHPNYSAAGSDNDVAILRAQSFINYGTNVNRISIAGSNYNLNDNTAVTVMGWGAIRFEGPKSNQLLKADLLIINQETCRRNYNTLAYTITQNMQCAGNPNTGADFCEGDTGSPLVHQNVLVGIASFRTPVCGRANYPGIYTRVSRYSSWIQNNA
ncbi:trypsin, alkaline C-like [Zerene cesonia]|uniref:trypsin, alkaline C-like n=1 Tax=Zerene cesonia TaxID=33412 RepID=UPI0018E53FD8|nr:trypsin, alkaline C-like [Zerene cesonia]